MTRRLKEGDAHCAARAERYHVGNRAIPRAESEVEPVSDEHAEELKRQRLALLDEIAAIIAAERTTWAGGVTASPRCAPG